MLQLYLRYVQGTTAELQEVRLICKEHMVSARLQLSAVRTCGVLHARWTRHAAQIFQKQH
jgi:hypothetical protein